MGIRPSGNSGWNPPITGIQSHVDLVVMKVSAGSEHGGSRAEVVSVHVLCVQALLQARIMLLKGIAMDGIIQEISEIRVKVEQRPAQKPSTLNVSPLAKLLL